MKTYFERKFKFEGNKDWINLTMGFVISLLFVFIFNFGFYTYNSYQMYEQVNIKEGKSVLDTAGFINNIIKDKLDLQEIADKKITNKISNEVLRLALEEYVNTIATMDKSIVLLSVGEGPVLIAQNGKTNAVGIFPDNNLFRNAQQSFGKRLLLIEKINESPEYRILFKSFRFKKGKYDVAKITKFLYWKFNPLSKLALGLGIFIIFSALSFLVKFIKEKNFQFITLFLLYLISAVSFYIISINFAKADYQICNGKTAEYYSINVKLAKDILETKYNFELTPLDYKNLIDNFNRDRYNDQINGYKYVTSDKVVESDTYFNKAINYNNIFIFVGWFLGFIIGFLMLFLLSRNRGFEKMLNNIYNFSTAYIFIFPGILGMMILVFIPIVFTIILGFTSLPKYFTEINIVREFVGFENFARILGVFNLKDVNNFYYTLFFTILYTLVAVLIQSALGIVIAVMLNQRNIEFKGFYQVVFILPWIIPTYISGLLWNNFFSGNGVLNQILQVLSGKVYNSSWLQDPAMGFFIVAFVSAWYAFPFIMLVTLSALGTISPTIFEAAMIDGAGWWTILFKIILPMIRPTVLPSVLLTSIWTFNNFNLVYLLTGGDNRYDILITRIYDFVQVPQEIAQQYGWTYGFAAAYSTLIFIILLVYIIIFAKSTNITEKTF